MRSLDIGATGMLAQQTNVDVISNNIANMTTTGFKRQRADFKDLIYQNINRPGASSSDQNTKAPVGLQLGLGVKVGAVYRLNEQGTLQVTSNPLDMAIDGNGFFQITMPDGTTAYTRDGVFQLNADGQIVTGQGYLITPNITVPKDATEVDINLNGQVQAKIAGQTAESTLGQIQTAKFVNPTGLAAIGDNLLVETDASGAPTTGNPGEQGFGSVRQGSIENSNVDVVEEMTKLITAQRAYEMNSNVISTSGQMLQTITQLH
jgi:flagellar basal-body rod protein FlgG